MLCSKSLQHNLLIKDYQFDIGGGEKFDNLSSLIDYYKDNPMVATSGTVITLKQVLLYVITIFITFDFAFDICNDITSLLFHILAI